MVDLKHVIYVWASPHLYFDALVVLRIVIVDIGLWPPPPMQQIRAFLLDDLGRT